MSQENRISFPQLHMRPLITVATSKVNVNIYCSLFQGFTGLVFIITVRDFFRAQCYSVSRFTLYHIAKNSTIYTVREDGWENSQFLLWLCHLNCMLIDQGRVHNSK